MTDAVRSLADAYDAYARDAASTTTTTTAAETNPVTTVEEIMKRQTSIKKDLNRLGPFLKRLKALEEHANFLEKKQERIIYLDAEFRKKFCLEYAHRYDPLFGGGTGYGLRAEERTKPWGENLLNTTWDSKTSKTSAIAAASFSSSSSSSSVSATATAPTSNRRPEGRPTDVGAFGYRAGSTAMRRRDDKGKGKER